MSERKYLSIWNVGGLREALLNHPDETLISYVGYGSTGSLATEETMDIAWNPDDSTETLVFSSLPFVLKCEFCDLGPEVKSVDHAYRSGWTDLMSNPEQADYTFIGTCLDCQNRQRSDGDE